MWVIEGVIREFPYGWYCKFKKRWLASCVVMSVPHMPIKLNLLIYMDIVHKSEVLGVGIFKKINNARKYHCDYHRTVPWSSVLAARLPVGAIDWHHPCSTLWFSESASRCPALTLLNSSSHTGAQVVQGWNTQPKEWQALLDSLLLQKRW